jgi:hypothetical protein
MRISPDVLRVSALVAAGVASGYLWRAALDPLANPRVAAPVIVSVEPFVHPAVIVTAPRATKHTVQRHRVSPKRPAAKLARQVSRVTRVESSSRPVTGPRPTKPTPRPKPQTPTPPATVPVVTSAPAGQQASVVTPPAASPAQAVGNDTGNGKGKKNNGSDKGDAAASPPQTDADRNRPGWGNGDKNHDHSGPHGK